MNKSWRQHPTKHQLYGPLPPITKTLQTRRTRHAGHCWRCRDKLITDVLLWTPTYGRAKAGQPSRTYIQQLCEDSRCSPEDLPEAMNDRDKWRERIRDIDASGTTSWWWWRWWFLVSTIVYSLRIFFKISAQVFSLFWSFELIHWTRIVFLLSIHLWEGGVICLFLFVFCFVFCCCFFFFSFFLYHFCQKPFIYFFFFYLARLNKTLLIFDSDRVFAIHCPKLFCQVTVKISTPTEIFLKSLKSEIMISMLMTFGETLPHIQVDPRPFAKQSIDIFVSFHEILISLIDLFWTAKR